MHSEGYSGPIQSVSKFIIFHQSSSGMSSIPLISHSPVRQTLFPPSSEFLKVKIKSHPTFSLTEHPVSPENMILKVKRVTLT